MGPRYLFPALLLLLVTLSVDARRNRRPNVIILFADDLGYGDLQVYGHPTSSTPNLNRLARDGKVFTQFYAAAAICSPSRAALLTGRYHMRSGIYPGVFNVTSSGGLPHGEETIAEMLKGRGYYTAMVGKWHLGVGLDGKYLPPSHGFDEFLGLPASHSHCPCSICFHPNRTCVYSCKQNFSPCPLYNGTTIIEQPIDLMTLDEKYATQARKAIRKSVNGEKPFFLYYSFQHTHDPQYADWRNTGATARGDYGDALAAMDWEIGEVMAELDQQDIWNDTFIFFSADNGPSLSKRWGGSVGLLKCGKATTYEGGVRVPAIAHWRGRIKPGYTLELSSTLDLLPTVAKITGARLPSAMLDGVDMAPFLFNGGKSLRETFFYYSPAASERQSSFAVRYKQYKAHFYTKGSTLSGIGHPDPDCRKTAKRTKHNPPLLYDLHRDPAEQYNIAYEPEYQDIIKLITRIREDFDGRMEWAVSEMHKPSYDEYMPCCNPGCEPQPYCCHCTLTTSIAYNPWELYTDIWQDSNREAKMKRKERKELFKREREDSRRQLSFMKDQKRGRDNTQDVFLDSDLDRGAGRDRIRDGNREKNRGIFDDPPVRDNDRDRVRDKPQREKETESTRERVKVSPRGRVRIITEEDPPSRGDRERGRDRPREGGGAFGDNPRERRREGSRKEARLTGQGSTLDEKREAAGSGNNLHYLNPTSLHATSETPNLQDQSKESGVGYVGGGSGSHQGLRDATGANINNYFGGFFAWDSSNEQMDESSDGGIANPLADTQVQQVGSTFEEVFETTTDAPLAFDAVAKERRRNNRDQKNIDRRQERQNKKEVRRIRFGVDQDDDQTFDF
ncbi:arylsulfatase A-like [Strongylocentrotus purpuratus]|uniref:Sulfatase N-terminal domain-containing protein n=1 Tax=Strongylocentrotus purpuratus TaxID=7668 RepID=A0A7M7P7U2_STRPU|nr:arylsulfatase A-like [Strongylocentrotus purpuratus]